jgi:serine/threonine protein kinase
VQRDTTRREGQLPLREVWLYADPLALLGMATRLLVATSAENHRPSPILQSPETGSARAEHVRNSQVYVYGLLLYSLLTGSLPSYGVPSRKLADLGTSVPALIGDLLYELLLDEPERRPDPNHAQRWLADLRSVLAT